MTSIEKLEAIQSATDNFSVQVLRGVEPERTWSALELGAGSGTLAYWLTAVCGTVTAVDLDVSRIHQVANLTIVEADVTDPGFEPGSFDLIHARYLFAHLPTRDAVLAKAVRWLKPGGALVLEEPYQLPEDESTVAGRIMAAWRRMNPDTDLHWARSIPSRLGALGLSDVDFTGRLACMGNLDNDRWEPLIADARAGLLANGLAESDLDSFAELLKDPSFIDIPQFTIAAWARKDR